MSLSEYQQDCKMVGDTAYLMRGRNMKLKIENKLKMVANAIEERKNKARQTRQKIEIKPFRSHDASNKSLMRKFKNPE